MRIGEILKNVITNETFKVLNMEGDGEYAWVTLLNLRYELKCSNYMCNLNHLTPLNYENK